MNALILTSTDPLTLIKTSPSLIVPHKSAANVTLESAGKQPPILICVLCMREHST